VKLAKTGLFISVLSSGVFAAPPASAQLIPSADGLTVYDNHLHVVWLANANLAGTPEGASFGVSNIGPHGAMDFKTALAWVDALNGLNGVAPLLGHTDWQLPTQPVFPVVDPACSATGPNGNSFGYGCKRSAMGSLYNRSLHWHFPDTAVPIPSELTGPFRNFQPYLYWSDSGTGGNGYQTFSFNTGWEGSNVDEHYMYVLPMIKHQVHREGITYTSASVGGLLVSSDGEMVYDPDADVTWLADADLAKSQTFGVQCIDMNGAPCINPDGAMSHTAALNWIAGMNAYDGGAGWLSQTNWRMAPIDPDDPCGIPAFWCDASPMGELFYDQLQGKPGKPVVPTPHVDVGPFNHLQPYLYWACGSPDPRAFCQDPPAPGFQGSFSFGNGFQGTDVVGNFLYVMVYYPETAANALGEALHRALPSDPELGTFLTQAAAVSSAPDDQTRAAGVTAFVNHVLTRIGQTPIPGSQTLTPPQANELIMLVEALLSS
jgi:hypothetical protein